MSRIVIVGGGTAGWLTAAYLSASLGKGASNDHLDVTLVEASDIPPIGVGEATVPSIRETMEAIGVSEYDFMRECDATFKHGIRFVQWCQTPQQAPGEYYFHPFERPLLIGPDSLAGYWLRGGGVAGQSFADAVSIQQQVSSEYLSPKPFKDSSYAGPMPYAYHLDAGKLAVFLKKVSLKRGVKHEIGAVKSVHNNASGNIDYVTLADGKQLHGDVFIDCTGFLSLLIEKHYKEKFIALNDVLFCDKAVVCQRSYDNPLAPIRPYTTATAQESGWIWDIGLRHRRGTGYVYASDYISDDAAAATLREYHADAQQPLTVRQLDMKVGYRNRHWVNNCIALGLSGGFIEPLESTGIHLIELGLKMLGQMLPRFFNGGQPQSRFNEIMTNHYDICVDFVKLHYFLSSREDSAFWRDNRSASSAPNDLVEKVQAWESGFPNVYDMRFIHSIFDHSSYQYILFGMGRRPKLGPESGYRYAKQAEKVFANVQNAKQRASRLLPAHREIIEAIHKQNLAGSKLAV